MIVRLVDDYLLFLIIVLNHKIYIVMQIYINIGDDYMFNEEWTKESVETLEKEIKKLMDSSEDNDEVVSRIMFKVLMFTLQNMDNNILHNYSWKYFNENKEYFMNIIP